MTTSELMTLINLATKDLKEVVCTYHFHKDEGQCLPKCCTKNAIKRRIVQLRADLLELAKELDEE